MQVSKRMFGDIMRSLDFPVHREHKGDCWDEYETILVDSRNGKILSKFYLMNDKPFEYHFSRYLLEILGNPTLKELEHKVNNNLYVVKNIGYLV